MPSLTHTGPDVRTPDQLPVDAVWIPAVVPGGVHESLMAAGLAEHPFLDEHEDDVRWVEDRTWWYRFPVAGPAGVAADERVTLVLPSVDTVASVWFNGEHLGDCANAFRPFEADVTGRVRADNELLVRLAPPLEGVQSPAEPQATLDVLKAYAAPAVQRDTLDEPLGLLAGDARVTVRRKPTCSWGWDFGPRVSAVGVLEPPQLLVQRAAALTGVHVRTVALQGTTAQVAVDVHGQAFATGGPLQATVALTSPTGVRTELVLPLARELSGALTGSAVVPVPDAVLWWTHDLGEPALYDVTVELAGPAGVLDGSAFAVGLRTVELDRSPDVGEPGRVFRFLLNGVPVFARGANWVPASALRGSVEAQRVRDLVELARDGGHTMIRVWGGGAYEQDAFYDACDELGVLVWQDFMFACFDYPGDDPALQQEVAREAAYQVSRLRNHASLALWCGNNEIETVHEGLRGSLAAGEWGWSLFHAILPDAVRRHSPGTPYWPGSPWGEGDPAGANGSLDGDRHFWTVWHGNPEEGSGLSRAEAMHWRRYAEDDGKFSSEFGLVAAPQLDTLARWTTGPLDPAGRVFQRRIKDIPKSKGRRLFEHELGKAETAEQYVAASMACQAEGLKFGVEHYRRRQPHCNGALVWQLNDVWPGFSWSVIDHDLVPKAGYWFLQRAYAPVLAGFRAAEDRVELWVSNSGAQDVPLELAVDVSGFDGTVRVKDAVQHLARAGTSVPVWSSELPGADCFAWVSEASGIVPANRLFFGRLGELPLADGSLHAELEETGPGTATARLRAGGYAYFSRVVADCPGVRFSQNYLDLRDGQTAEISVSGLPTDRPAAAVLTALCWSGPRPWT